MKRYKCKRCEMLVGLIFIALLLGTALGLLVADRVNQQAIMLDAEKYLELEREYQILLDQRRADLAQAEAMRFKVEMFAALITAHVSAVRSVMISGPDEEPEIWIDWRPGFDLQAVEVELRTEAGK